MWTLIIIVIAVFLFFIFKKKKSNKHTKSDVNIPDRVIKDDLKPSTDASITKFDFVVIDFEYADRRQFACQLGIVPVYKGQVVDKIEYLIQPPENSFGPYETSVHGINAEMTKYAPTFEKIWDQIKPYFQNQKIVCHGAATDINVLKKTCAYYQIAVPEFMVVDTINVFGKRNLSQLADAFNVEYINKHNALSDAFVLAQVYLQFMNGKPIFINKPEPTQKTKIDFSDRKINKDLLVQDLNVENKDNPFYNKTVVITGVFQLYSRNNIAEKFKSFGANVNGTVSKKTDFVIVGDDAGPSKLMKIAEYNKQGASIKLLMQDDLENIIAGNFENI